MNKIALLGSVVLTAAITGCQTMQMAGDGTRALNPDCPFAAPAPKDAECHGGCTIWVEVVDVGGVCKVVVGTSAMRVKVQDAWIVWWLPDERRDYFEFKYEGTPFTAPVIFEKPVEAEKQFSRSRVYHNGLKVRIDETGSDAKGTYKYTLRVYKRNSSTFWEIDPAIINDF